MPRSQLEIPGTEQPRHPKIDEACDNYCRLKLKAKDLREKLKDAEVDLVMAMKAKELTCYRYEDTLIKLEPKDLVKVCDVADGEADE